MADRGNSSNHSHLQTANFTNVNRIFIVGISLNLLFVIVEFISGFLSNSLSLISDAGHNLTDVATLALSLFAMRLLKSKRNDRFTYGYRKTSILVALFNSIILLVTIGAIVYEAIHRLINPRPLEGLTIVLVASIGTVVNAVTAFLFLKQKEHDLNIKSAYLHLLSDAGVSLAVVLGGVFIYYTNYFWIDSLLSILVAIVILFSTWRLLVSSLRLSLDGIPENIHLDEVVQAAQSVDGINDFHHVHIWAISTTENALTAHMVVDPDIPAEREQQIKQKLREELRRLGIHHITIETERSNSTECKIS